jgi:hypothetical protein
MRKPGPSIDHRGEGGTADVARPVQQSRRLIERLNDTKVPARLVVREGVGHAYSGWEADATVIAAWFEVHLGPVRQRDPAVTARLHVELLNRFGSQLACS